MDFSSTSLSQLSRLTRLLKVTSESTVMVQLLMLREFKLLLVELKVSRTILLNSNSKPSKQVQPTTESTTTAQSTLKLAFSSQLAANKHSRFGSRLNNSRLLLSRARTTDSMLTAVSLMKLARFFQPTVEACIFKVLLQAQSSLYSAQTTYSWQSRTLSPTETPTTTALCSSPPFQV